MSLLGRLVDWILPHHALQTGGLISAEDAPRVSEDAPCTDGLHFRATFEPLSAEARAGFAAMKAGVPFEYEYTQSETDVILGAGVPCTCRRGYQPPTFIDPACFACRDPEPRPKP